MPTINFETFTNLTEVEVLALYESVGWSAYTKDPETLFRALRNSTCIVTARDRSADGRAGALVGLSRVLSDDATICYVQDILVTPDLQRTGIGRMLLTAILERFADVRQVVLITDDEPAQRLFYESMGLTEGADFTPSPIRIFARFNG